MNSEMKKILFPLIATMLLLVTSCEKEVPPVLDVIIVDNVMADEICCHANVLEGGVEECGFYYGTSRTSVINERAEKVQATYASSSIKVSFTGLKANTTYYIKGYAMNEKGRAETEIVSIKTLYRIPESDDNNYPDITQ